ncbi:unknown [Tannerella sp. CAG:118]|nr:unknown [Tannerella sp. CAG:118]
MQQLRGRFSEMDREMSGVRGMEHVCGGDCFQGGSPAVGLHTGGQIEGEAREDT